MPNFSRVFVPLRTVLDDVWMFDTRSPHFRMERKITTFLFLLLIWNFISYSPILSMFVMQSGNLLVLWMVFKWIRMQKRGATDDQISKLRSWRYKKAGIEKDHNSSVPTNQVECCICLAKYAENEEMRELPCSHMFHQMCVDKWLRIKSTCPICNQELEKMKID